MIGQVRPTMDARVCTVAVRQIRLESLHHRDRTVEPGGRNSTEPPKTHRTDAGPATQGTAMQAAVISSSMLHDFLRLPSYHLKAKWKIKFRAFNRPDSRHSYDSGFLVRDATRATSGHFIFVVLIKQNFSREMRQSVSRRKPSSS